MYSSADTKPVSVSQKIINSFRFWTLRHPAIARTVCRRQIRKTNFFLVRFFRRCWQYFMHELISFHWDRKCRNLCLFPSCPLLPVPTARGHKARWQRNNNVRQVVPANGYINWLVHSTDRINESIDLYTYTCRTRTVTLWPMSLISIQKFSCQQK